MQLANYCDHMWFTDLARGGAHGRKMGQKDANTTLVFLDGANFSRQFDSNIFTDWIQLQIIPRLRKFKERKF